MTTLTLTITTRERDMIALALRELARRGDSLEAWAATRLAKRVEESR